MSLADQVLKLENDLAAAVVELDAQERVAEKREADLRRTLQVEIEAHNGARNRNQTLRDAADSFEQDRARSLVALRRSLGGARVAELEAELARERARTARWEKALLEFGDALADGGA